MTTTSFTTPTPTRLPRSTLTRDVADFFREDYEALFENSPPPKIMNSMRSLIESRPAMTPRCKNKLLGMMRFHWFARLVFDEYEHDLEIQSLLQEAVAKKMQDETMDLAFLAFVFGDHVSDVLDSLERRGLISRTKARVAAR